MQALSRRLQSSAVCIVLLGIFLSGAKAVDQDVVWTGMARARGRVMRRRLLSDKIPGIVIPLSTF